MWQTYLCCMHVSCVKMQVYLQAHIKVCIHLYGVCGWYQMSSLMALHLLLWNGVSHWSPELSSRATNLHALKRVPWLRLLHSGITGKSQCSFGICRGAGDLISSLKPSVESTLPAEPSFQPYKFYSFKKDKKIWRSSPVNVLGSSRCVLAFNIFFYRSFGIDQRIYFKDLGLSYSCEL